MGTADNGRVYRRRWLRDRSRSPCAAQKCSLPTLSPTCRIMTAARLNVPTANTLKVWSSSTGRLPPKSSRGLGAATHRDTHCLGPTSYDGCCEAIPVSLASLSVLKPLRATMRPLGKRASRHHPPPIRRGLKVILFGNSATLDNMRRACLAD